MKPIDVARLVLAILLSPLVAVLLIALAVGGPAIPRGVILLFMLFGYGYFFVIGMPIVGILVHEGTWLRCTLGGAVTAAAPFVLFAVFGVMGSSLPSVGEVAGTLALVSASGGAAGTVFWLIAFARRSPAKPAGELASNQVTAARASD